jgi:PKD repeat protein
MWCRGFYHYDGSEWHHGGCWAEEGIDWAYNVYGIWGVDADQIWASGDRGSVLESTQYEGFWNNMDTPTEYDLWDIWGTAADNIYAVGDRGTIIHHDGASWQSVSGVPTLQSLNAIWGSGSDDVFVVGDWGTILHHDGAAWQQQTSGTTEHLVDLWGRHAGDLYAVGLSGTVLHYDGAVWTAEDTGLTEDFLSVWGVVDLEAPCYTVWAATRGDKLVKKTLPAAAFVAVPTSGISVVTPTFTNTSTAGHTSVSWAFGDGEISAAPSPTHTYDLPGAYTVTLQVGWPGYTDTLTRERYIHVYEPVQASFTATPTTGIAPLTVAFTNTTTGDYDASLWSFGDGITGTLACLTHTYTTSDVYTVILTAAGPGGIDTWQDTISVSSPTWWIHLPLVLRDQ